MNKEAQIITRDVGRLHHEGNIKQAYSYLVSNLQRFPNFRTELKSVFISTLCSWGKILECKGLYNELFASYESGLKIFESDEKILSNLGAHLFRLGFLNEASYYFHKALQTDNNFLPALRNLESVYNLLVERWHFRMLNDSMRNQAYREAIIKKVKQGYRTVLDIGSGTSLLSLYAVEGGAHIVYACDCSETMIKISEEVLLQNNVKEKVKLLHKLSHDISIPEDIPSRVSLVITETFDGGLLGENILQSLIHAWNTLLLPRQTCSSLTSSPKFGLVIPYSADLWIGVIECNYISRKYRVMKYTEEKSTSNTHLNFVKTNLFASDGEPYDTLDLQKVNGGFRFLTTPVMALQINFNAPEQLEEILRNFCTKITTKCIEGQIDALAMWFDLHLDEDIVLSSAPTDVYNHAECWDQAVYPLKEALYVIDHQEVNLLINIDEGKLLLNIQPIQKCKIVKNPLATGIPLNSKPFPSQDYNINNFPVSPSIITYLNDELWITATIEVAQYLTNHFTVDDLFILDLSPFPVLGLTVLINTLKIKGHSGKLLYLAQNDDDAKAIEVIAQLNNLHSSQLERIYNDKLEEKLMDYSEIFDIVSIYPIESSGKLSERYINLLPMLSKTVKENGWLIPKEIKLCCKLIHCTWLNEVSRVLEDRVHGYRIAPTINRYQVSEHLEFCLSEVVHDNYSQEIEVIDLTAQKLICSLEEPLKVEHQVQIIRNGSINAVPYWFKLALVDSINHVTTSYLNSFVNQTAILIEPEIDVKSHDNLHLRATCYQGLMNITLQTV